MNDGRLRNIVVAAGEANTLDNVGADEGTAETADNGGNDEDDACDNPDNTEPTLEEGPGEAVTVTTSVLTTVDVETDTDALDVVDTGKEFDPDVA